MRAALTLLLATPPAHAEAFFDQLFDMFSRAQAAAATTGHAEKNCDKNKCSETMNNIVRDDEKSGLFVGLGNDSPWQQCHNDKMKSDPFGSAQDLLNFLAADSNTAINDWHKTRVRDCLANSVNLPEEKKKALVTRYYYLNNRLQNASELMADELGNLDRLLNDGDSALKKINCTSSYPKFDAACARQKACAADPSLFKDFSASMKDRYEEFKKIRSHLSALDMARTDWLVSAKRKALEMIGVAAPVADKDVMALYEAKTKELHGLKNYYEIHYPVLAGEKFRNELEVKYAKFDDALRDQLKKNRRIVDKKLAAVLKASDCFSSNQKDSADCSSSDINELIKETPELPSKVATRKGLEYAKQSSRADIYLGEAMCTEERKADRSNSDWTIGKAAISAPLMAMPIVGTMGRAAFIARGMATAGEATMMMTSNVAAYGFLAGNAVEAYDACISDDGEIKNLNNIENSTAPQCGSAKVQIAAFAHGDRCLAAAAGLAVAGAPALANAALRGLTGVASDGERVAYAKQLVDRPLTAAEEQSVIDAHNYGTPKFIDGKLQYSAEDIKEKARILQQAGFKTATQNGGQSEIRKLMESRVVGKFDDYSYVAGGIRLPGMKVLVKDPETGHLIEGEVLSRKPSGMFEVKIGEKKGLFKTTPITQHYNLDDVYQNVKTGDIVAGPRTGGYVANGRVVHMDPFTKEVVVEFPYSSSGKVATRTYSIEELQRPIERGESVWVLRSNGEYTYAQVESAHANSTDVKVTFRVNGQTADKTVSYSEISRTKPSEEMQQAARARAQADNAAKARAEEARAREARGQQQGQGRDQANGNAPNREWQKHVQWRIFQERYQAQQSNLERLSDLKQQAVIHGVTPQLKEEAKQIYRRLASAMHEDKYPGAPPEAQKFMKERFQEMKQQFDYIDKL